MKIKRSKIGGDIPVYPHDKGSHVALAGFNLVTDNLDTGDIVPAGAVLAADEQTRQAWVIKGARLVEDLGATATAARVGKGHLFKANDIIVNDNGVAVKINSINKSNAIYDVLNTATPLGSMTAGQPLSSGAEEAEEGGELFRVPFGLNNEAVKVDKEDHVFVTARIRTTVYARRIPPVTKSVEKALPNIFFSQSF